MRKHNLFDTSWHVLKHDPVTHKTIWVKFDEGLVTIRETIPDWLATAILEKNKQEANDWQSKGGWKKAKLGAVVASIPTIIDTQFKKAAGWNPSKSGHYDLNKYNSFLDDIDYRHLRTGGGKIGRRKAEMPMTPTRLAKVIGAS